MSEAPNIEDVRAHAQSIVERAKSDSAFASRLKEDPEGTLREAGLDEQAVPDFTRELTDVEAHLPCRPFSCLITVCTLTDW